MKKKNLFKILFLTLTVAMFCVLSLNVFAQEAVETIKMIPGYVEKASDISFQDGEEIYETAIEEKTEDDVSAFLFIAPEITGSTAVISAILVVFFAVATAIAVGRKRKSFNFMF